MIYLMDSAMGRILSYGKSFKSAHACASSVSKKYRMMQICITLPPNKVKETVKKLFLISKPTN